jgi:two-component system phosphate regulon sensor histidine kinase PhoR
MKYDLGPGFHAGSPRRVRIQVVNNGGRDSVVRDTLPDTETHAFTVDTVLHDSGGYSYGFVTDSTTMVVTAAGARKTSTLHASNGDKDRFFVVTAAYDDLFSDRTAMGKTVNPALLDSVLKGSMRDAGIPLPFAYGIISPLGDSVLLATPPSAAPELRTAEFRTPLFHLAFGPPAGELAVVFSGRTSYLLGQLWPTLGASVLFVVIIALSFVYTLRTIIRQQRLAGAMVDFINNMTHEFKTPISTVTLASEAIGRADVLGNAAKVRKYNGMIAEETQRMKTQVDRILEMAVIEEGDFELSRSDVDLHDLIRSAAGNAALGVESRGGRVLCSLEAERHVVRGDAVHLANIVHNLLDNASKYSSGPPDIRVSTANEAGRIVIRVSDRGIGIAPEHIGRVFDKYYRVPTGNIHDVKGFGLGLRYVRLLVEAHGGDVSIRSRKGEGTEVTVRFPEGGNP